MSNAILKVTSGVDSGPPALFAPDPAASKRFIEFFTANIRNPNTRKAYARAVSDFAAWWDENRLGELQDIEPVHFATYVETLQRRLSAPSVKLHLAALRMLFDWLVVGQVLKMNPAAAVRGPKHSAKKGKTPVLAADEARALLDSIDAGTPIGLRDRALIAAMVYTFGRVGAVTKMRVEDVYVQGRRTWIRLHEKGGKDHDMPAHHSLDEYLHAHINGAALAGDSKGVLFRTSVGRSAKLTDRAMSQADVYRMIARRALAAQDGVVKK
ncbi:tyrosine-type recombinase/integrase [Pararobbsia alpina]|uniref:Tyrosine recombinase XerC n=1 Tax=Pararobbsia alpina TaxID=621374 RepID=A0A6S7C0X5_9BURK|nr:tyrosine-type recombinase/integrase [Pararobbsia alpina]CAB3805699.1 Tyrosine recombinase XerC [Pararobbsia alpina]